MRADLLVMAAELARREEPFVLAIVVTRRPPSSTHPGDAALITASGELHGWLGGSCTLASVTREAQRALAEGTPRLLRLSPDAEPTRDGGVVTAAMTCASGGAVEIYLEPIAPASRLVVFGDSPTARALERIGAAAGYAAQGRGPCYAVVATMGEGDAEAILEALALCPVYLGVIASRRRFAEIREALEAQGVPAAAIDAIRSPAGLDIGASRPEEIAISVLAEIVKRRPVAATTEHTGQAIDPICGMTVDIASARSTAVRDGQTYYFCGAGCRARFLA